MSRRARTPSAKATPGRRPAVRTVAAARQPARRRPSSWTRTTSAAGGATGCPSGPWTVTAIRSGPGRAKRSGARKRPSCRTRTTLRRTTAPPRVTTTSEVECGGAALTVPPTAQCSPVTALETGRPSASVAVTASVAPGAWAPAARPAEGWASTASIAEQRTTGMLMRARCRAAPAYIRRSVPTRPFVWFPARERAGAGNVEVGTHDVVTPCQPFRIEQIASSGGGALVISVHGELDYFTVASLRLYLSSLAAEEIVIRLHELSFCDSSGLALLLELKQPGRTVRFEGISGQVRETLQRTGTLDSIEA